MALTRQLDNKRKTMTVDLQLHLDELLKTDYKDYASSPLVLGRLLEAVTFLLRYARF